MGVSAGNNEGSTDRGSNDEGAHERGGYESGLGLRRVSSAVMGLQALLRPLEWVSPAISVLPRRLEEFVESPVPLLAGYCGEDVVISNSNNQSYSQNHSGGQSQGPGRSQVVAMTHIATNNHHHDKENNRINHNETNDGDGTGERGGVIGTRARRPTPLVEGQSCRRARDILKRWGWGR